MFPRPFTFIYLGLALQNLCPGSGFLSASIMASWARPGGDDISRCASWHHVQTQPRAMQPQDAAVAMGVQGSKGCQLSPAIQTGVSTVLSHPVSETLSHVARFQALVCTHWEDFFLLGGASAPILGYKCLCLLRVASTLLQESSGNPQTHTRHSSTSDTGPFEFFQVTWSNRSRLNTVCGLHDSRPNPVFP